MVMAACMLHNVCSKHADEDSELMMDNHDEDDDMEEAGLEISYDLAARKRDAIADAF